MIPLAIPPLAAETLFTYKNFPVTNSYVNTTLAMVLFIVMVFFLQKAIRKYYDPRTYPLLRGEGRKERAPRGFLNFFESFVELLFSFLDQVTGDRKKSFKFLPIVGSFFLFILIANWLGLMPGTGSITIVGLYHEELHNLPLFRPSNTDLNMTIAMSVLAVSMSHFLGIATIGFFKYINRFLKFIDLWKALKKFNPMAIFTVFVEMFIGLIEIFSEIAKMISLSLRLYGNIFAGEVLLTVIAGLVSYLVPLPFMGLEILVGFIQAMVFAMLTLVYLNMATTDTHGHGESGKGKSHVEAEEDQVPAF